ncbi:MAG: hypothetical protein ACYS1A_12680 [Planctomycetota bacterium]
MKRDSYYKIQLITAWSAVGVVMMDYILIYLSEYLAGLSNKPPAFACLFTLILWPSQILLLLISVISLIVLTVGRRLRKKQFVIGVLSFSIALIACVVNFPLMKIRPAGAQIFLKGFEKWVDTQVDMKSIQLWIQVADEGLWESRHCYGPSYPTEERIPEEFPDFLKDFEPQYLWLERSELDGSRRTRFEWGGPMFHWSLVIGDPNMKMPEQEVEWFSDYDVEFRRILQPGVYIFSRG